MDMTSTQLQDHPLSDIFPLMTDPQLASLAEDIRQHGQSAPIWLYEGKVLDGRNRLKACQGAGVTPTTRDFAGSRQEALSFVWGQNFHRRHLNPSQAAVAEAKRAKLSAEYGIEVQKMKDEAAEKQKTGKGADGSGGRGRKRNPSQQIGQGFSDPHERRTAQSRAQAVGSNRRYMEAAEKLLEEAPERLEAVEKGQKSLSQVIRETNRAEKQARLAALPSQKYRVVYADPPWSYGNSGIISDLDQ